MTDPRILSDRVRGALSDAAPSAVARADQLAALWREFFAGRDLDLTDPVVNDAVQRALTMVYGLAAAARSTGEIDDLSWTAVSDIVASGTTAVVVLSRPAPSAEPTLPGI